MWSDSNSSNGQSQSIEAIQRGKENMTRITKNTPGEGSELHNE